MEIESFNADSSNNFMNNETINRDTMATPEPGAMVPHNQVHRLSKAARAKELSEGYSNPFKGNIYSDDESE